MFDFNRDGKLDSRERAAQFQFMDEMMKDDEKGKELTADGDYVDRDINEEKLDSQEVFYETAYKNTEKKSKRTHLTEHPLSGDRQKWKYLQQ